MKLAVLGIDDDSTALAEAAVEAGHSLVCLAGDTFDVVAGSFGYIPHSVCGQDWEDLLSADVAQGILVSRGCSDEQELRQEQLRRLAQQAVPLLVAHPICDSLLFYLELDMIAGESGGLLQHYFAEMGNPALERLARYLKPDDDSPRHDATEQIIFERYLSRRDSDVVFRTFARDAELLEALVGPFHEITALGCDPTATEYTNLSVQLMGDRHLPVRWSVHPARAEESGKISLCGQHSSVNLVITKPPQPWELSAADQKEAAREPFRSAEAAVARFVAAVESPNGYRSTWRQASRAMELADSIELSLRKGRTIEVHYQLLNQQTAFRGTMAMAGCGLLLATPLLIGIAAIFGAVFRVPLPRFWYVLLALMLVFLVFQLVPKLIAPQPSAGRGTQQSSPEGDEHDKQGKIDG